MNCKKCGSPLNNDQTVCGVCGTPIEQETNNITSEPTPEEPTTVSTQPETNNTQEESTVTETPIENSAPMAQESNASEQSVSIEKKKKTPILLIIIILLLLGVGGFFGYNLLFKKSERIVKSVINNAYQKLESSFDNNLLSKKADTALVTTEMQANTNIEGLEDLNNLKLKVTTGIDYNKKNAEFGATLIEGNTELLEGILYFLNNNMYIILKDIYEKPISINSEGTSTEGLFNSATSQEDLKFIIKEYKEILINSLDMNDFKQSSDTITIKGKEVKVTKTSYVLDKEKSKKLSDNIIDNTLKNEKLLERIAKLTEVKVDDLKEMLKASKGQNSTDDGTTTFNIYTKGIKDEFVGLDLELPENSNIKIRKEDNNTIISSNLSGMSSVFTIKEESKNKYTIDIKINVLSEEVTGTIAVENKPIDTKKSTSTIVANLTYQKQTIKMTFNITQQLDAKIADINTKNAKKIEDISEEEMNQITQKIMEKLQNSKIYKSIMEYEESLNSYNNYNYNYESQT